jgi:hypothetical protein
MALLKKREAKPDLAAQIVQFQAELDAFINEKTSILKASASGRDQPFAALRRMLTRGNPCLCAAALTVLANEEK